MTASLDSIALPDETYWVNEWAWTPVPQNVRIAIDGTPVIEVYEAAQAGRPIVINSQWIEKDVLDDLETSRDGAQATMTLTVPDGRSFDVVWDHRDGVPLEVEPVVERPDYTVAGVEHYFNVTLKFIQV